MPVKVESFLADHAWKLMWGLPAAMTEFSLTYRQQFGIQEIVVAFVWMPAGAVCVVQS